MQKTTENTENTQKREKKKRYLFCKENGQANILINIFAYNLTI